jgi:hypothetical protein
LLAQPLESLLLAPNRHANPTQVNRQQADEDTDSRNSEEGPDKDEQHDQDEHVTVASVFPNFLKKGGPHKVPADYS